MALDLIDISSRDLPLEDFINLPTTVSFQSLYSNRFQNYVDSNPDIRLGTLLPGGFAIAYTHEELFTDVLIGLGENFIDAFPVAYTTLDVQSLADATITRVHSIPDLNLRGQGVLLGFVDTGIDYTQPSFIYEDGTSKIRYIWDQSIDGNFPEDMRFGSVYSQEDINQALRAEDPYSVVPQRDTSGHGTFLASVAGGREMNNYGGAAPDSEIIAVKLKKARPFFLQTTSVPADNEDIFQSDDIMMALKFIIDKADELDMPVAICIALGTNFGGHDGLSLLEEYMSSLCNRSGVVICTAAGNESNARHHTDGVLSLAGDSENIRVRVGDHVPVFSVYIWNDLWDRMTISIQSPSGQIINRIPPEVNIRYVKTLALERSVVVVSFHQLEGRQTIVQVYDPTPGVWHVILQGDIIVNGEYHAWLPITGMISPEVDFIKPVPNYTIVNPASAIGTITCGAYNSRDNSLYVASSWGPTRLPRMSPDFVAPGVNVGGVYPWGYGTATGTSVSAAITTGASALLLQWGIVQRHEVDMDCNRIRALMVTGCERDPDNEYPNVQWGYGRLDLYNTFNLLMRS